MDIIIRLIAAFTLLIAISGPAHAYLDPVTGSLIVQGLVALIAGIVAGVKTVRQKILAFVTSIFKPRVN